MKKLLIILGMLFCASLFAEETVLIKSDASAELEGFDFITNFEIASDSGWFSNDKLFILSPNEKGFRFMAKGVPEYLSSNYKIVPAYPVFLNEPNTGAGFIENASTIKTIRVTATTNRPYDQISILYSTSAMGPVKEIKMPQDFNAIKSMEEFTLTFENPLYEPDVKKREVVTTPILGGDIEGLYLRGIKITTNPASGFSVYSPYSVFYLKEVSIVYDKLFTDEQLAEKKALKEDFGIDENAEMRNKAITNIKERERIRENEKALMDKSE